MTAVLYNLIIFHTPGRQDVSDFMTVRNMMMRRAPEIEVHIVSTDKPAASEFWETAAQRPSLLFSPMPLRVVGQIRGYRLIQSGVTKLEEVELLTREGFPVPETRPITPELTIDKAGWGPFTVLKPNRGFRGNGVRLVRTQDVRWIDTATLPETDPRHGRQLLAQRYIDTGSYLTCYRVMTVLGRPIYCVMSEALESRAELDASQPIDVQVAANGMARRLALVDEPEIVALARSIHTKLPKVPVMGLDIIREHATGRLFVLEFNSPGRTWHISSDHGRKQQSEFGLDYYRQFNALDTITDALIEATRKHAV